MFAKLAACLVLVAFSLAVWAAEPVQRQAIVLLQPEQVIAARVSGAQALADYLQAVQAAASRAVAAAPEQRAAGGFLVIAVKPERLSNAWLDIRPALPAEVEAAVIQAMRAVPPPAVREGPVVMAICVSIWNGTAPTQGLPSPIEWQRAVSLAGQPLETGDLVERIWRP